MLDNQATFQFFTFSVWLTTRPCKKGSNECVTSLTCVKLKHLPAQFLKAASLSSEENDLEL